MSEILAFDTQIFQFFNSLAGYSKTTDILFIFSARYVIYLLAALLLLFFWKKRFVFILALSSAFLGRGIFVILIREFYFRSRPFLENETHLLIKNPDFGEASFPSGHTTVMFAFAFAVFLFDKKWGTLFFLLATISALSRIVVGVHYPFDILGGIFFGALSVFFVYQIFSFFKIRSKLKSV